MPTADAAPHNILVLGGLSAIGRHVVRRLVEAGAADAGLIRVVDRSLPKLAHLNAATTVAFERVEYVQANLNNVDGIRDFYTVADGRFHTVYNCSTIMKPEQSEEVYKSHLLKTSLLCAEEAVRQGVSVFVHLGSAMEYSDGIGREDSAVEPFSLRSKYMQQLDDELRAMPGLNAIILRIPLVYGPADTGVMASTLVCMEVQSYLKIPFPMAMDMEMRRDLVHTVDAARALIHLADWYVEANHTGVEPFNISMPKRLIVADYIKAMEEAFPHYKYQLVPATNDSLPAEVLEKVRHEVNEDLLFFWLQFLGASGIANCPFSPIFDSELYTQRPVIVDASRLGDTGFTFLYSELRGSHLLECIQDWKSVGVWPTKHDA